MHNGCYMGPNRRGGRNRKTMTPPLPMATAGVSSEASKPGGNRNDRRFIVNQPAYVSSASAPGQVWTARICDISRRGMQLILEEAATLDTALLIAWNGREIRATVRYQQLRGDDYH